MPARLPSQTTFQPVSRRYSATASAGKMCPPVPPAMIIMVREELGVRREGDPASRRSEPASFFSSLLTPPSSLAGCVSYREPPHQLPVLPVHPQQHRNRAARGD